jgi:hypothetical protein
MRRSAGPEADQEEQNGQYSCGLVDQMAFLVLFGIGMRGSHGREALVWIVRMHGQASSLLENLKRNQVGNQLDRTVPALAIPLLR